MPSNRSSNLSSFSTTTRSSDDPLGQEFLMHQGTPRLITWPISGNPLHQKDFLQRLQASYLPHGGQKPTQTMGLSLPERGQDPLSEPVSDIVNFWLSFNKGISISILKLILFAIASTNGRVDGFQCEITPSNH